MDLLKFGWRASAMIACNKCGVPIAADDYDTNWTLMCDGGKVRQGRKIHSERP